MILKIYFIDLDNKYDHTIKPCEGSMYNNSKEILSQEAEAGVIFTVCSRQFDLKTCFLCVEGNIPRGTLNIDYVLL